MPPNFEYHDVNEEIPEWMEGGEEWVPEWAEANNDPENPKVDVDKLAAELLEMWVDPQKSPEVLSWKADEGEIREIDTLPSTADKASRRTTIRSSFFSEAFTTSEAEGGDDDWEELMDRIALGDVMAQ